MQRVHFQVRVGVFNCQQILAKISFVIFDIVGMIKTNGMWVSVALVKFHWFGINWRVFNQSECRNCCLYVVIQKIAPQAKSGKHFQIWFFPRFGGKKWRRSEHAHASYPGLFFRPPGLSPCMGREERRVQGLDYVRLRGKTVRPWVGIPKKWVSRSNREGWKAWNNVNIWNLLSPSRPLIIWTDQANI